MKETRMWAKKKLRYTDEGVRNKYNYPSFVPMAKNVLIYSAPKNISTPSLQSADSDLFLPVPPTTHTLLRDRLHKKGYTMKQR